MAENQESSPVFANRYRFEPVDDNWDTGRTGFTHPAFDIQEKLRVVIKRVDITSPLAKQREHSLHNEADALKKLDGLGVPKLYGVSQAVYGKQQFAYLVIEYIDGIRVEKNLDTLSVIERVDIITQFYRLLYQAHRKGIVNGDVDLKHLFWRNRDDKNQLVVIDWGNAKLGIESRKKTEFAYDLARSAEIIFSLITHQGHPPATGSLALPDPSGILNGLEPIPNEFRVLCEWAPRTPGGKPSPYTAKELYEISKTWFDAIQNKKRFKQRAPRRATIAFIISMMTILFFIGSLIIFKFFRTQIPSATPSIASAVTVSETRTIIPKDTPPTETIPPVSSTITETPTSIPLATASSKIYSPIIIFDQTTKINSACWENEANPASSLLSLPQDGFYQRTDNNWSFTVSSQHSISEYIQVDFSKCAGNQKISALAFNIFVQRLDQYVIEPPREVGIFVENQNGQRREYTFLLNNSTMILRVRDGNNEPTDYPIQVINPANIKTGGEYPRPYSSFSIMLFLEINNQNLDIIYLLEGPLGETVKAEDINPNVMFRMENAIFPSLGNIQEIGLVGRGGKIEAVIWPLNLLQQE